MLRRICIQKLFALMPIPPYRPSILGGAIIESMRLRPDEWIQGHCTFDHMPSGIQVWAANGTSKRRIWSAPDLSNDQRDAVNTKLSYGDRVAIELCMRDLRKRTPTPEKEDGSDAEKMKLIAKLHSKLTKR